MLIPDPTDAYRKTSLQWDCYEKAKSKQGKNIENTRHIGKQNFSKKNDNNMKFIPISTIQ